MVYFISNKATDAETDLKAYAEKIFDMSGVAGEQQGNKPKVCLNTLKALFCIFTNTK